jgi:uncharacterized RDD family membrane protein YckC
MVDRRDWAGWLQGPRKSLESQGYEFGHPGERLKRPETGPGSIARFGRRLAALSIDWLSALLLARALSDLIELELGIDLLTLFMFFMHTFIFITLFGGSFGHRITGMQVQSLNGARIGIVRSAVRQFLVCLVVPAVIYDRDQRGLHDRLIKAVLVRV